jgi:hypothetical protein
MPFYIILALFGAIFGTADVYAATCVEDNSCENLGYTKSSCPNGGIACPYDTSKWHCADWSCADGRYSPSIISSQDCVEVSYKGLTCYDCQEKTICAAGSYATAELCQTATGKTCVINTDGCYIAKVSTCATGTYESSKECVAANPSASGCIKNASTGCYSPVTAITCNPRLGLYSTSDACKKATNSRCVKKDDCWVALTLNTCLDYPLTNCPSHATCSKCDTDSSKLKFDSCDTNYYNTGTDASPTCTSCSAARANLNQMNTIAKLSYLNCCSDGNIGVKCRQNMVSDCTNTSRYGSWIDGCLSYKQTSINTKEYTDLTTFKNACINALKEIADTINDFNTKCPNYTIKNVVSPSVQCSSVIINGLLAYPSYNSDSSNMGCSASDIGNSDWSN